MGRLARFFGVEERSDPTLSIGGWLEMLNYAGQAYGLQNGTLSSSREEVSQTYTGFIQSAYKSNGVVFACMLSRMLLFSEARFQFRQVRNGRPGDLFGTQELQVLETPWPNGTTGDLLTRAIQDADLEGNFYAYRDGDVLRRMRPDWVSIALGSQRLPDKPAWASDAEIVGYGYHPGGFQSKEPVQVLLPEQVIHFAPIPDPQARYRGMSWLTPLVREIQGDGAAMEHKLKFFESGATPNMVVTVDPSVTKEAFDLFTQAFREQHEGALNAYKTLFLGGGSSANVVGSNFQQMDFKVVQGLGETRIAAAAGVPPVIVGLSEGLAAATYSNYAQARRRFTDGTMRPLWRNMAASAAQVVNVPPFSELWYDDRDILFLAEDQTDAATIQQIRALSLKSLIDAGFEPDSSIEAITNNDFTRLIHSGLYSVQLQPAGKVSEGKGAVVSGVPVPAIPAPSDATPAQIPAVTGQNAVRALLERFLDPEDVEEP